jgi:hypothetical protein
VDEPEAEDLQAITSIYTREQLESFPAWATLTRSATGRELFSRGSHMLKLESKDLYSTCTKCGGTGTYREVTGSRHMTTTTEGDCPDCERGLVLTELGKVMVDFVGQVKHRRII